MLDSNQEILNNAKENNLSILSIKDILKTEISCVSLCIEKKDLLVWRHIKHKYFKPISDFSLLVGNERGKQLKNIMFRDFMKNLTFFVNNPYISNNMISDDENIHVIQQLCLLPVKNNTVDFGVKFLSSINNDYNSTDNIKTNPSHLIIISSTIGTSVQLSTGNDVLFFNDNGREKTYNIVVKESTLKINDFIEGNLSTTQSNGIIYIYQIPIKQTKNKILTISEKTDTDLLTTYNNTSSLTPGIIKNLFVSTNALCIQRNKLLPIICTIQHYDVSFSSNLINLMYFKNISSLLNNIKMPQYLNLTKPTSIKPLNHDFNIDDLFEGIECPIKNNFNESLKEKYKKEEMKKEINIIDDLSGLF